MHESHWPFFFESGEHTVMFGRATRANRIVDRTFVITHLLSGHIDLAESATLEAIDGWKPETESVPALIL
jgi:hypothetical protein